MSVNQKSLSNFVGVPVLYPATTLSRKPLETPEYTSLKAWFDSRVSHYTAIDPVLGMNFSNHLNFFIALWQVAKAKFQQVSTYPPSDANDISSAQIPGAQQIGIQDILPEDINRNQTGAGFTLPTTVSNGPSTWDINGMTAGTAVYLLGDSVPTYFSTSGTEPNRYILGIIKNGLVEIGGNVPASDQIFYTTKQNAFNPSTVNALFPISEVQNKSVSSYDTPGAIILDEVTKATMTMMPKYSHTNSRIAFIGCKIYEYSQYTSLLS